MADEADLAFNQIERLEKAALAFRKRTLQACGSCHYCAEPVHTGLLFCDPECAAAHEEERATRERQGVK